MSSPDSVPQSAANEPPASRGPRRFFRGRFLIISIVLHVLLALVATYLVVQTLIPRKQTFQAGKPSNPSQSVEHRVQVAQKQKSMTAPASSKRITTTGLAKLALPEMPEISSANSPGEMQGLGMPGAGLGTSPGGMTGSSGGAGAAPPLFGLKTGNGLAGTFYDLKQTRSGQPNEMKILEQNWQNPKERPLTEKYRTIVERVVNSGFSRAGLTRYYVGPTTLYTTQIFVPPLPAVEGPKAFNLPNVEPRRWIVIYSGKVIPPESGKYRFVGVGDDWMAVRFNGRVVLNHGFFDRVKPRELFNPEGLPESDFGLANLAVGDAIEVQAGAPYPLEVLIGEGPGGQFDAFLLLKKEGETYQNDSRGNPKFPIFKMAPSKVVKAPNGAPVTAEDAVWSVWKARAEATTPGSSLLTVP